MSLTVYGAALSPFVRKVRVFLAEKGLDYTLENVNIFPVPDWFAEISPLKRIPVLKDDDVPGGGTLPDSSVVCAYLEKKYPAPALYPAEPYAYGRALWFEEYADSELAGHVGMGVFRPVVLNRLMKKDADHTKAQATIDEKLPSYFAYLDKEIGDREFFVGDAFSIADISVATQFVNFKHAGYEPDAAKFPLLASFVARTHARPSFAACIEQESAMVASFAA